MRGKVAVLCFYFWFSSCGGLSSEEDDKNENFDIGMTCQNPSPLLIATVNGGQRKETAIESNIVQCHGYFALNGEQVSCDTSSLVACDGSEPDYGNCTSDSDCESGQFCMDRHENPGCICTSPCLSESDCGDGEFCLCVTNKVHALGNAISACVTARCEGPDDCTSGVCSLSEDLCLGGYKGAWCRNSWDDCVTRADCDDSKSCVYSENLNKWTCLESPDCD